MTANPDNGLVLVWGATGQAKVLRPIIEAKGLRIGHLFDRDPVVGSPFDGVSVSHDMAGLCAWVEEHRDATAGFAVAVGGEHGRDRIEIATRLAGLGLRPIILVHERAWVARSAALGEGCQVLGMAAVSEEARLGRQCIVNTSASVDHECVLGDGVHVMPGATLAGCVRIGDFATIGSGATVLPRMRIGTGAMVGAGAVVTRDVAPGAVVTGIPARGRAPSLAPVREGKA